MEIALRLNTMTEKFGFSEYLEVLGPTPCIISKINGYYRYQILIKNKLSQTYFKEVSDKELKRSLMSLLNLFVYILHDDGMYEEADRLFLAVMILDGVPVYRALMAYLGVRIGGHWAWKEGDNVQK